jgi:ferric iron reductase protein FhuF
MNVILPVSYKSTEYVIEYNEPDSTPEPKDYIVRIESIKCKSEENIEMEEQVGKEFSYKATDIFKGDVSQPFELIIKTYRDHIEKDVDQLDRV